MSTLSVARSRTAMPAVLVSVLVGTIPLVSACGAGQKAPTRLEYSVADGVQAHAGNLVLRNLQLTADVADTEAANVLDLHGVIANATGTPDQLTGVTAADGTTATASFATLSPSPAPTSSSAGSAASAVATSALPVGSALTLGSTGLRLQVRGLKSAVLPGSLVSLTFTFQQAGSVTVAVPVYTLGSRTAPEPTTSISYPAPDVPGIYNQQEFDNQPAATS